MHCPGVLCLWEVSLVYSLDVQKYMGYDQRTMLFFFLVFPFSFSLASMVLSGIRITASYPTLNRALCEIPEVDASVEGMFCYFLNTAV